MTNDELTAKVAEFKITSARIKAFFEASATTTVYPGLPSLRKIIHDNARKGPSGGLKLSGLKTTNYIKGRGELNVQWTIIPNNSLIVRLEEVLSSGDKYYKIVYRTIL